VTDAVTGATGPSVVGSAIEKWAMITSCHETDIRSNVCAICTAGLRQFLATRSNCCLMMMVHAG
jgi:hypothetical protein